MLVAVPVAFFVIAFLFSMLGMGGSQLYIPVLFWFGLDFKTEAIPLGMLLNVVNSSSAAFVYTRNRLIDWSIAVPFAIAMVLFAPLGAMVNANLDRSVIMIVFSLFTATAATLMLAGVKPKALSGIESGFVRGAIGVVAGGILGFFAGLIGRGGGSFVVPLLYMLGLKPKNAAATSAFVVTCAGISSFVSHIAIAAHPRPLLWILCTLAVLAGSQTGSRFMVKRLKDRGVRKLFAGVLIAVAVIIGYQALAS